MFTLWLISFIIALSTFCFAWWIEFKEILVRDVCFFSLLSSVPIAGLIASVFAIIVVLMNKLEIMNKRIL